MNCPTCEEPMIVLEHEQVEIDHCVSCGGTWLDQGELELLVGDVGIGSGRDRFSSQKVLNKTRPATEPIPFADHLLSSFEPERHSKEKPRKCPICFKKMEKVLCNAQEKIRIDRCVKNDGFWFDSGELERILQMEFAKGSKVLDWLKNIFVKTA